MTDLARRVLAGETRSAARLCRLVDERTPGYREHLRALGPGGGARVVGVTGSPGAGKSTLVDRLVAGLRARGLRVGVVAVDPSSPYTGGAILGDRIRMQQHFEDPDVFIRSVATRGAHGGLSRSTRDVVRVLEAWGARVVLVETVGVGQDELDVQLVAETTIVVSAPGQGDDVQAIKAGILEIADVFVVNKADRPAAENAVRDLENMLALGQLVPAPSTGHSPARPSRAAGGTDGGFSPRVLKTVATRGEGVPELLGALDEHAEYAKTEAGRASALGRRARLAARLLVDALGEAATAELASDLESAAARSLRGNADLDDEIDTLVRKFRHEGG
ncbi:MAG TPA: methylmalonyl Co-A mutase-associated GTPase MeaB [Polyangiaceae bacterium]|nr:methylmalonyl Co-A mutase-associated GTPase MeaB [Polyangiaceae bacterium]